MDFLHHHIIIIITTSSSSSSLTCRDVTEPPEIHFHRMRILWIKIRRMRIRMQICWCTIKVQPNTLVKFKKILKNYFYFIKFYFAADFYERLIL